MLRKSFLAVCLSGFLATGCGGDGGGGNGLDKVCNSTDGLYVDLIDEFLDCYPAFIDAVLGGRPSRSEIASGCTASFEPHLNDGTISVDASAIAACRAYIDGLTCSDAIFGPGNPCDGVIVGAQGIGGACDDHVQCTGDTYCEAVPNQCGACAARRANGMTCTEDDECASRLCNVSTCDAILPLNAPCTDSNQCGGLLVCDTGGNCANPATAGTACANEDHCGWPLSGLYCDGNSQCATYVAVDSPCAGFFDCDLLAGETCDGGTLRCVAPTVVGQGQTCNIFAGTVCSTGLVCTEAGMMQPSTCESPHIVGSTCVDTCNQFLQECVGGQCQYGQYTGMCPVP